MAGIVRRLVVGQEIGIRRPHAVVRRRLFGKPPAMLDMNDPRIDPRGELGFLPDPASLGFYPHPRPFGDAEARRRVGVDFGHRIAVRLAQLVDLPVLGVEEVRNPPAGGEHQRVIRGDLRRAERAFRRLLVTGQWRVAHLLEAGGIELDLAGRRLEAAVLVFPVLERDFVEAFLLNLLEGHADAAGGELGIEHVLHRFRADRKLHAARQLDENFFIRLALADTHRSLICHHDVGGDGGQSGELIDLGPRCRRQHDVGEFRRRRHEQVGADHEIERHQRFVDHRRIGISRQRVVAEHQERFDRIGFAFAHRPQQRRDMRGRQVGALPAEQLELVCAQSLGIGFRREVLDQAGETAEPMHAEHPAARHIDVAGDAPAASTPRARSGCISACARWRSPNPAGPAWRGQTGARRRGFGRRRSR